MIPRAVRDWRPSPRLILVAAWLTVIVYAFPGYMNYDVAAQLIEMRSGVVTDFHPPMMGGYWRILEVFVHGPFLMLVLQTTLFLWGLYSVLCHRLSRTGAAWAAAAIFVFPAILAPMGMIWKDAQMTAFLMAGTALVVKPSRAARVAGIVLFVLASGVRHNGAAALPFLLLGAAWTAAAPREGAWTLRRRAASLGVAAAITLSCIGAANFVNERLTDRHVYFWYRTTAIFDIVGTICHAPPLDDQEVLKILDGIKLTKVTENYQRTFCERIPAGKRLLDPWFEYAEMFDWEPTKADRQARKRAWKYLVRTYPGAYLEHRLTLTHDLLGLDGIPLWEPVGQDFAANPDQLRAASHDHSHSWFQRTVGDAFRWLANHTFVFRAYVYLFLSVLFFGFAVWKRDLLAGSLLGSGLLYELSLAIGANAPDFRYSLWMICCTCLGAVLIAVSRWRIARPAQ